MDDIASVMLRLADYETRSSDGSQQPKQSPASWKSAQCTTTKEKLWKLLDAMLTGHLRDDKLDVRKVSQDVIGLFM